MSADQFAPFGPWTDGEAIRRASSRWAASSGSFPPAPRPSRPRALESGWLPSPLPAIFSDEPGPSANGAARARSLGGSLLSQDIGDDYLTPFELGYGRRVAFDHRFAVREALERLAAADSRRRFTLVWERRARARRTSGSSARRSWRCARCSTAAT